MKLLLIGLTTAFLSLSSNIKAQEQIRVIPYPALVSIQPEIFPLKSAVNINTVLGSDLTKEANFLKERLSELNYKATITNTKKTGNDIKLTIDKQLKGEETYKIVVKSGEIVITGGGNAGIFYGIQTLLQELKNGGIHYGEIQDAPRYPWRGYMLDEARHFSGKAKVKQLLDIMSYYKLNKLHWHLTDEQGWRIEIKKYPRLTTIGGVGCWSDPEAPAKYYTQDDIREIIQYATDRHIEVIPEIDMPGHATASNRAYPEYCGGGTEEHPNFTFNVGKEETYTFLSDILKEVTALFPSPYLHIGGDEVAYGIKAWETDPFVQDLMKRENLKTVKDAERYFMHRMSDTIYALGKTQIGWDELLDLNVDTQKTVIMWWRHDKPENLTRSLAEGYTTILCPRRPLYFDFVQHKDHKWGRIWDGFCPLEDVYAFPDKLFASLNLSESALEKAHGMQANLWAEQIHNTDRLDYMTFPRMCALAESAWSAPSVKNYDNFVKRMEDAFTLFDQLNIYYFDFRNPERHPEPAGPTKKDVKVDMNFRD